MPTVINTNVADPGSAPDHIPQFLPDPEKEQSYPSCRPSEAEESWRSGIMLALWGVGPSQVELPEVGEELLPSGTPACIGDGCSGIYGDSHWFNGWLSNWNACRYWIHGNYCPGGCVERNTAVGLESVGNFAPTCCSYKLPRTGFAGTEWNCDIWRRFGQEAYSIDSKRTSPGMFTRCRFFAKALMCGWSWQASLVCRRYCCEF